VILVTVGTQFFDALINEVDRLAAARAFDRFSGAAPARVFAQIGLQQKLPQHIEHVAFDRDLVNKARHADLIITHAGTGSLLEFLPMRRPLIAVANPTKADNHQLEFLHALDDVYDFCWIAGPEQLESALPRAVVPLKRHHPGDSYNPGIGADIAAFITRHALVCGAICPA
jgi:UDP-N-acetylglucosamine transferase subunit ALG13